MSVKRDVDASQFVEDLSPENQERLGSLKELNEKHEVLEDKYEEERKELEQRYQKLYEPLHAKRAEIVAGAPGKGPIPRFWLQAMLNAEVTAEVITKRDEDALEFLSDVRLELLEDATSFTLTFQFRSNPYFEETELTKTYHLVDDEEPILEKAVGSTITWKPNKDLSKKKMTKKSKNGGKPVTKVKTVETFFDFFSPPNVEEIEALEDDEEAQEDFREKIESDFEVGALFRERLVPHAVLWFTGEAVDDDDMYGEGDEDDDYDDDEEDEVPGGGRQAWGKPGGGKGGRKGQGVY